MITTEMEIGTTSETTNKTAFKNKKKGIPFGIHFAEKAESQAVLREGLEAYDDPTTADTTGDHEDPHTDSD